MPKAKYPEYEALKPYRTTKGDVTPAGEKFCEILLAEILHHAKIYE